MLQLGGSPSIRTKTGLVPVTPKSRYQSPYRKPESMRKPSQKSSSTPSSSASKPRPKKTLPEFDTCINDLSSLKLSPRGLKLRKENNEKYSQIHQTRYQQLQALDLAESEAAWEDPWEYETTNHPPAIPSAKQAENQGVKWIDKENQFKEVNFEDEVSRWTVRTGKLAKEPLRPVLTIRSQNISETGITYKRFPQTTDIYSDGTFVAPVVSSVSCSKMLQQLDRMLDSLHLLKSVMDRSSETSSSPHATTSALSDVSGNQDDITRACARAFEAIESVAYVARKFAVGALARTDTMATQMSVLERKLDVTEKRAERAERLAAETQVVLEKAKEKFEIGLEAQQKEIAGLRAMMEQVQYHGQVSALQASVRDSLLF